MLRCIQQATALLAVLLLGTYFLLASRMHKEPALESSVADVKSFLAIQNRPEHWGREYVAPGFHRQEGEEAPEFNHSMMTEELKERLTGIRVTATASIHARQRPEAHALSAGEPAEVADPRQSSQGLLSPAQRGSVGAVKGKEGSPTRGKASMLGAAAGIEQPPAAGAAGAAGGGDGVKIIDLFIYNGEPVVELRLPYLGPYVDEVVVVEARTTFSGRAKPQLFVERDAGLFAPYEEKVTFLVIDSYPEPDREWVEAQGGKSWVVDTAVWFREAYQRNYAARHIRRKYAGRRYVVLACDVDEIPSRTVVQELRGFRYEHAHIALYFEMEFSYYNFAWTARHPWYRAFALSNVGLAQNKTLDQYRTEGQRYHVRKDAGWHLSYYMGLADLARKLESFSHSEYDAPEFKAADHVLECIRTGRDLFNRGPAFDMLAAGPELRAQRPFGWEVFAERLAVLQEAV